MDNLHSALCPFTTLHHHHHKFIETITLRNWQLGHPQVSDLCKCHCSALASYLVPTSLPYTWALSATAPGCFHSSLGGNACHNTGELLSCQKAIIIKFVL